MEVTIRTLGGTLTRVAVAGLLSTALAVVTPLGNPAHADDSDAGQPADLDTATSTTSINPNGSYSTRVYDSAVNYESADGSFQPIDNTLVSAPGAAYAAQNEANDFKALIPANASSTPIEFIQDGAWVTMAMHGLSDAPSLDGSTATFSDVTKADSVDYTATSAGLKEDIVLSTPPNTQSQLGYVYTIDASSGVTPTLTADGAVDFDSTDGTTLFSMPAGIITDSAPTPASSGDVTYSLITVGSEWQLSVTPSMDWLENSARQYPVTLDPSIESYFGDTRDCYIGETNPTTPHCGDQTSYVSVGRSSSSGTRRRGLLNFSLSGIPSSATVTAATANLYLDNSQTLNTSASANYALYRAGKPFTTSATWNDPGDGSGWSAGAPGATAYGTQSLNGSTSGVKTFAGLTPVVQGWVDGSLPNNGLVLMQTPESVNNYLGFFSDASSNSTNAMPYLDLTFTLDTSDPNYVGDADASPPPNGPDAAGAIDASPDKLTWESDQATADQGNAKALLDHNQNLEASSARKIHPPGGTTAHIKTYGYSYVKVPFFEFHADFTDNIAKTWWTGRNPYNADDVWLTETWQTSGIDISVSLPPGAGVSGSGGTAYDVTHRANDWKIISSVDTVHFGASDIYRVRHTTAGKFGFGSNFYTVTGTDSHLV